MWESRALWSPRAAPQVRSGSFPGARVGPNSSPDATSPHGFSATLDQVKLDLPRDAKFDAGIWYSTAASTWYPTHYHDELELKIVLWGRVVYEMATSRVELGSGSLLWLGPGQPHTLVELSNDLAMWVSSFRVFAVRAAERQTEVRIMESGATFGTCDLGSDQLRQLSALCSDLVLQHEPGAFNQGASRLLARALVALEEPVENRLQVSELHPAVARAVSLLHGPDGALTLEALGRRCGLSAPRLSRLFKQQMGLSLVQYRNHHRVQRFISQFGHGEQQNMLEVALQVGFGSYPQFHRAFCQVTGYSPTEHLRRLRMGIVAPTEQVRGCAAISSPSEKDKKREDFSPVPFHGLLRSKTR